VTYSGPEASGFARQHSLSSTCMQVDDESIIHSMFQLMRSLNINLYRVRSSSNSARISLSTFDWCSPATTVALNKSSQFTKCPKAPDAAV
jgi:hypothetical protein